MPGSLLTLFLKSIDGYHIQETGALCLHWRAMLKRSDPCGVKLGDENGDNSKSKRVLTDLMVHTFLSWKELSFGAC